MSKETEVQNAADARHEIEKSHSEMEQANPTPTDEELAAKKAAAEEMAKGKVQAKAHTIDGKIDIEAMGDVKGDGGDAKNYADDDPAKALGVPVYEHGLHETRGGTETSIPRETALTEKTLAEQKRGAEVQAAHQTSRDRVTKTTKKDDNK